MRIIKYEKKTPVCRILKITHAYLLKLLKLETL